MTRLPFRATVTRSERGVPSAASVYRGTAADRLGACRQARLRWGRHAAGRPLATVPGASDPELVALALPSGGVPYYAGRAARIEPTAWALLALTGERDAGSLELTTKGRAFLHRSQRADGLLLEAGVPVPNYGWNGLALLALNDRDDGPVVDRLATGLLKVRGIQIREQLGRGSCEHSAAGVVVG